MSRVPSKSETEEADRAVLRHMPLNTMVLDQLAKQGEFHKIHFLLQARKDAHKTFVGWLSGLATGLLASSQVNRGQLIAAVLLLVRVAMPLCGAGDRRSLLEAHSALRNVAEELAELLMTRAFELRTAPGALPIVQPSTVRASASGGASTDERKEDGGAPHGEQLLARRSSGRLRAVKHDANARPDYVRGNASEDETVVNDDAGDIAEKRNQYKKHRKHKTIDDDDEDFEVKPSDGSESEGSQAEEGEEDEVASEDVNSDEGDASEDGEDNEDIEGDGTDVDFLVSAVAVLEQKTKAHKTSIRNILERVGALEATAAEAAIVPLVPQAAVEEEEARVHSFEQQLAANQQVMQTLHALQARIEQLEQQQVDRAAQVHTPAKSSKRPGTSSPATSLAATAAVNTGARTRDPMPWPVAQKRAPLPDPQAESGTYLCVEVVDASGKASCKAVPYTRPVATDSSSAVAATMNAGSDVTMTGDESPIVRVR